MPFRLDPLSSTWHFGVVMLRSQFLVFLLAVSVCFCGYFLFAACVTFLALSPFSFAFFTNFFKRSPWISCFNIKQSSVMRLSGFLPNLPMNEDGFHVASLCRDLFRTSVSEGFALRGVYPSFSRDPVSLFLFRFPLLPLFLIQGRGRCRLARSSAGACFPASSLLSLVLDPPALMWFSALIRASSIVRGFRMANASLKDPLHRPFLNAAMKTSSSGFFMRAVALLNRLK